MNKKRLVIILAIVVIVAPLIVWLFLLDTTKTNDKNLENVSVRMKWFYSGTMTGWFAGIEQGFFKENGIDLTINPGGPNNNAIKLVAAGTDIFGVTGAEEVLIARNKGIPIVAIGVLFKDSPIGFISKKEENIYSPADWSGKNIEVDYGSNAEFQYRALIRKFDIKGVKETPYSYSLIPFINGDVDISVAYIMDQVVTLRKQGIELNVLTSKEFGINPYGDVIITSERTLKENPDLVFRFMDAVIKSHKWAIEHPDASVNYLIKNADDLKFENEIEVWKATIPFIIPDNDINKIGKMDITRWQATMKILVENDVITKDIDLSKAVVIK